MVTEKEKAVAKEYLAGKTIKGIWVNSAAELFSSKELAIASDEDAEFVRNTNLKDDTTEELDADKKETGDDKTTATNEADTRAANLKLLEETELKKENYQTMAALIKAFDVKTEGKSAEVYIEALTAFKATLKPV